jgi:1-acyl-sn-glycerol-3-phosphate acyltransferase
VIGPSIALRAAGRLARIGALATSTIVHAGRHGSEAETLRARAELFSRNCGRALDIQAIDVEVTGERPAGPVLIVSNHLSYLDPIVLAAEVVCVPISKSDLAGWPLLGMAARRCGVIFVERSSARSRLAVMREAEAVLRGGLPILNFPEGTTTDGSTLLRYRKGLFGVAMELGVPVVPVAITYRPRDLAWIGDDTFVPHYVRLCSLPRARATVTFGGPITPAECPDAEAMAETAHARTRALLGLSEAEPGSFPGGRVG